MMGSLHSPDFELMTITSAMTARLGRRFPFWAACGLLAGAGFLSPALGQSKAPPATPAAVAGPQRAARLHFLWSRQTQQDRSGYYYQPAGLCEDYPEADQTQAKLDRDFRCLRDVGAKVLRVGISWQTLEPERGRYHWSFWDRLVRMAVKNHVALIPYVCYTPEWAASKPEQFWKQPPADVGDFKHFMGVIAGRYKGKVHSWELWNEPDNQDFWVGSVGQYAALVKAGADGVHQADPRAIIVLGGMADGYGSFFETLIQQYQIETLVNVVNVHGYFETWNSHPLEDYPAYIAHVATLAQDCPHPPDVWLAEFGYSSVPPDAGEGSAAWSGGSESHTPDGQAVALFKSHVLALSTGRLSLTAWYRINDLQPGTRVIGDSLNLSLGILDVHGQPKPAFYALRFYNRLFGQPTRCRDASVRVMPTTGGAASAPPVVHVFETADGSVIVAGWLGSSRKAGGDSQEEISLALPHMTQPQMDAFDVTGQRLPFRAAWAGDTLRHVVLTREGLFIARLTPRKIIRTPLKTRAERKGRHQPVWAVSQENLCTKHSIFMPSASMPPAWKTPSPPLAWGTSREWTSARRPSPNASRLRAKAR